MHIHHKIKPEHMNVKGMIIEVATIVFAVLFALGVESFWEHHTTMNAVEMSRDRLNKEIENNLYEFVVSDTTSRKKEKNLLKLENEINNQVPFASITGKFDGYSSVNMNVANWKRILNDKVSTYLPVDYMEDAFKLYQYYDAIELIKKSLLQFIFSDLYLNKDKQKEAFEISKIYYKELLRHCSDATKEFSEFIKKYNPEQYSSIMARCDSLRASVKPKDGSESKPKS